MDVFVLSISVSRSRGVIFSTKKLRSLYKSRLWWCQFAYLGVKNFAVIHRTSEFRSTLLCRVGVRKVELAISESENRIECKKCGPPHVRIKFSWRLYSAKMVWPLAFCPLLLSPKICSWLPFIVIKDTRKPIQSLDINSDVRPFW